MCIDFGRLLLFFSLFAPIQASIVLFSLVPASESQAYESFTFENGGSITGRVTLKGQLPEPRAFPLVLYAFGTFCKQISDGNGHVLLKEFNTDSENGLQDAVVSIEGIERGKPFRRTNNVFVSVNCMFHPGDVPEIDQFDTHDGEDFHVHPLVSVLENHRPLYVLNRDPILHNGQVYQKERGNRIMNFPIPVSDKPAGGYLYVDEGFRIVQMICGMHEYMQTWGWIVDNPYHAKTNRNGGYFIDDIPPGSYTVTVWHPHLKPIKKTISVPPDGIVSLDFEFDGAEVKRPAYETQKAFRIGPERNEREDLSGCEGVFCVRRDEHLHP